MILSDVKNSFVRSVGMLVGGAAISHAILAVAMPFLSRLYSPADFSVLAVFSGLLSVIAGAACLRYDVAVPLPDDDAESINLLALAISLAVFVSLLVTILIIFFPDYIVTSLNQTKLRPYLLLLPLGVLLVATYSALQSWFVRKKQFTLISHSRVGQSAVGASVQIGLGVLGVAPLGLLVGYTMVAGSACVVLGRCLVRGEQAIIHSISLCRMRAVAIAYKKFPKYSTLEVLCNNAAIQVPVIMIAAMSSGPEAGYVSLAMYVMQAPMALIGTAIGQVYLSKAPDEYRAGKLNLFTAEIVKGLLKLGVGPLLFVGIVSPAAFSIVFGKEWGRAGELVSWMTPWFIMQFISSPISMALHVTGHQRTAMMLQLLGLATRVGTVWIIGSIASNWITEAYSISGFIIYLVYIAVILRAVSVSCSDLARGIKESLTYIVAWSVLGICIAMGIAAIER